MKPASFMRGWLSDLCARIVKAQDIAIGSPGCRLPDRACLAQPDLTAEAAAAKNESMPATLDRERRTQHSVPSHLQPDRATKGISSQRCMRGPVSDSD